MQVQPVLSSMAELRIWLFSSKPDRQRQDMHHLDAHIPAHPSSGDVGSATGGEAQHAVAGNCKVSGKHRGRKSQRQNAGLCAAQDGRCRNPGWAWHQGLHQPYTTGSHIESLVQLGGLLLTQVAIHAQKVARAANRHASLQSQGTRVLESHRWL